MTPAGVLAGLLAGLLAGCSVLPARSAPTSLPTGVCPAPGPGGAAIDYVPFVMHGGRLYSGTVGTAVLPETVLGPEVDTVRCTLAGKDVSPSFEYRDGDASYQPVGTPIRRVTGYREDFRLAVHEQDGRWLAYDVLTRDDAKRGSDVVDLSSGVTGIDLVSGFDGTAVIGTVDDPAVVGRVVAAVQDAPAEPTTAAQKRIGSEEIVLVRFRMRDGTTIERAWHRRAGYLAQQVIAPPELAAAFPNLPATG